MGKHPLYNTTGLQKNNKSHVLYALTTKQAELINIKEEYNQKIMKIESDIEALKRTTCLFYGDCEEIHEKIEKSTAKSRKKHDYPKERTSYFARGECKKMILDQLRESNSVLSTKEISASLQTLKGYSSDDEVLNRNFQKTIVTMLRSLEKSGLIQQEGRDGLTVLWKIKS